MEAKLGDRSICFSKCHIVIMRSISEKAHKKRSKKLCTIIYKNVLTTDNILHIITLRVMCTGTVNRFSVSVSKNVSNNIMK